MLIERINANPCDVFRSLSKSRLPFIISGGKLPWQRRFSIAGAEPIKTIRVDPDKTITIEEDGKETFVQGFFQTLALILSEYKTEKANPLPFSGGLFGYFSYDLKDMIEELKPLSGRKNAALPPLTRGGDRGGPDMPLAQAGLYDAVFVHDHVTNESWIASYGIKKGSIEKLKDLIKNPTPMRRKPFKGGASALGGLKIESNLSKDEYSAMIRKALAYIASGDIYQINLSRRLAIPIKKAPFEIYSSVTTLAPSRFPCFFDCEDFQILSNSPERFLRITGQKAETEPIKGTRPRGGNSVHDQAKIEELEKSPKENAEHVMIVDLERNDLGRISAPDTVRVESFKRIETYPALHHMVSTISGTLKNGIGPVEALQFMFPGGSVTGAPKIRAMEIIEELEPAKRGLYTGAIGYIDLCGDMDMSMCIRTAIAKDGSLCLSVGGGIVADSDPEEEYVETEIKAADFLKVTGEEEAVKGA